MNILLIGSGGREHALAWKIAQSPQLDRLYICLGNGGTRGVAETVDLNLDDHSSVISFCQLMAIDLVVVGPEAPLVAGLADDLQKANISVFGPSKAAAQLEGSKNFTKALCDRMAVPTAAYGHFTNATDAPRLCHRTGGHPIVVKADGLAAGKGVTVALTLEEAHAAIDDCFDGAFGDAGAEVVVEEFLSGEEASMFFLCDWQNRPAPLERRRITSRLVTATPGQIPAEWEPTPLPRWWMTPCKRKFWIPSSRQVLMAWRQQACRFEVFCLPA